MCLPRFAPDGSSRAILLPSPPGFGKNSPAGGGRHSGGNVESSQESVLATVGHVFCWSDSRIVMAELHPGVLCAFMRSLVAPLVLSSSSRGTCRMFSGVCSYRGCMVHPIGVLLSTNSYRVTSATSWASGISSI